MTIKQGILDGVSYPAADEQLIHHHLATRDGAGHWRPGIVGEGADVSYSGLTIYVAPFTAYLPTANGQPLVAYTSATEQVTLAARDATYSRKDLITVRPGSGGAASLVAVTGAPAASPTRPTAPTTDLVLYEITVPPGTATPTFVDLRTYTAAQGAIIPVPDGTRPANPLAGEPVWETGQKNLIIYSGSSWLTVPVASSPASLTLSASPATATSVQLGMSGTGGSDCTVHTTDVTVNNPGVYSMTATVWWGSNATGGRLVNVNLAGSSVGGDERAARSSSKCNIAWTGYVSAGQAFTVVVYQDSGGALPCNGTLTLTRIMG